jgi:predicted adenylyl cyclase CyaB
VLEQEVKLLFATAAEARAAVISAGATPLRPRRLQDDALFDTETRTLAQRGCALRLRNERRAADLPPHLTMVTFKGPVQPGTIKIREEHETVVADGGVLMRILDALGLRIWFRYQKYREEFTAGEATIAIDETPVGTFIEIEGSVDAIQAVTRALGRSSSNFILASYRSLFVERREQFGLSGEHMLFPGT